MNVYIFIAFMCLCCALTACEEGRSPNNVGSLDAGPPDGGSLDVGGLDGGELPLDGGELPLAADSPLQVGLAGAPIELFGPEDSPTFGDAFQQLAEAGFDTFFPLFVVSENDDASVYSGHGIYFLAPSVSGAPTESSCAGPHDPYAAAQGHVRIWYPGGQLLGLFDLSRPVAAAELQTALSHQRSECPSSTSVAAFYAHDEPSIGRIIAEYLGEPQLLQANVELVARVVRASWDVPVVSVEAPGEVSLRRVGLAEEEADRWVDAFWADVRSIAPHQDVYGFDVYTVPDFPLTLAGDHVRLARSIAPTQRIVSVLQGMAFGRITRDPTRGRAPTQAEIRFQAIDSIAGGADTLIWYGASSLDLAHPEDAQLWEDLRAVASELQLVRGAIVGEPVAIPAVSGLWIRAHRSGGELVVFVSHRGSTPQSLRLGVGPEWTDVEVVAGSTPTRDAQGWAISMEGLDAAILRFSALGSRAED